MNNKSKEWKSVIILVILSSSIIAQSKMYWANKSTGQINVSNVDGTETKTILSQNFPQYHFLDEANSKIYWTDKTKNAVIQCNLDGSNQVEIIKGLLNPKGIFIDSLSQFYIVDEDKILLYSKAGSLLSTFIDNLKQPSDIILFKGVVYWGNQADNTIEYKSPSANTKKVLLNNAFKVSDIEINKRTNEIYYNVNSGLTATSGIFKANIIDGKNIKQLTQGITNGFTIDAEDEFLYWGSGTYACIFKAHLNNLSNPVEFVTNLSNPLRILINKNDNKFYFLDRNYGDFLFSANLINGSSRTVLARSDVYLPSRFAIDTLNSKIYWVNSNSSFINDYAQAIMVANLDGSDIKRLLINPIVKRPNGIELDVKNNKIYWTDTDKATISSMGLDGSNIQIILNNLNKPSGLKLDLVSKKLFWTDWGSNNIMKANLDGSNPEEIIDLGTNGSLDLDISYKHNKLFWPILRGSVYSANLDGSDIVKTVDTESIFNQMDAVHIDELNSKLYFSDDKRIYQSDIDGSNIKILIANVWPSDIFILNDKNSSTSDINPKINIEIYPNPLGNSINISSGSIMKSIQIFDLNGQTIYKDLNISNENHVINIENYNFASGHYMIKVNTNDGSVTKKIVKL